MKPKRLKVSVLVIITLAAVVVAGYYASSLQKSTQLSWDSRGAFTHYENVTVPVNVSVSIPVATLSLGLDNKSEKTFSRALYSDMARVLKSKGLSPEFVGEETDFSIPGITPQTSAPGHTGPVIILFIPFYGQENYSLYRECYADVILYMNSNPDVESYLAMVEKYSNSNSKEIDDLKPLAKWLFKRAQANATGPYSLKVVYWNTLKARVGNEVNESCWDVLAGEIGKETDDWVRTLRPSDKP